MQHIFDTNETFQFENITLVKPTVMAGGNHFIRFLVNQQPIYIQPPKCKTKQGILRVGKRFYTDLVFVLMCSQSIVFKKHISDRDYCIL